MINIIVDTHALVWYFTQDRRLSIKAKSFMENTSQQGDEIGIASISFIELIYLIEKRRIPAEIFSLMGQALSLETFVEVPLNLAIARTLSKVPYAQIPEMSDRIIAATALHLDIPIISRDAKIQASNLTSIW